MTGSITRAVVLTTVLLLPFSPARGRAADETTPVLDAMAAELERSLHAMGSRDPAPFFVSYEVYDIRSQQVGSSFGGLTVQSNTRSRHLDVDLRVGTPAIDNTHPIRGGFGGGMRGWMSSTKVPTDDDAGALRNALWRATEARYRDAVEQLGQVQANVRVKAQEEDQSGDFTAFGPVSAISPRPRSRFDERDWADRVRAWTAPFGQDPHVFNATCFLQRTTMTRWHANSEGTRLRTSRVATRLYLSAVTKADDGMELPRTLSWFWYGDEGAPTDEEVRAAVSRMREELDALRDAPVVEPAVVPAILSGRAAGVFFHEILGHRLEAHRQKDEDEGQTLKTKVGERILPEGFSITSDPTRVEAHGVPLAGHYLYDNEGVPARPVSAVDHGVLTSFLLSRRPLEGFIGSNGHGRKSLSRRPVARQSNLLVTVHDPVTTEELEALLLQEIERQGKPWGLWFEDIQGGFTLTGRWLPNSFEVIPTLVYRVYPDGRRELVRGVDLIGTPLATLERLAAADDEPQVFNGYCGAESGWVPVSAVAPAVLLTGIEVQKKDKSQEQAPVLTAPTGGVS